jgi:hypothetical protein
MGPHVVEDGASGLQKVMLKGPQVRVGAGAYAAHRTDCTYVRLNSLAPPLVVR